MTGGFTKSGSFTGRAFSGGSTRPGLPVLGCADGVEFDVLFAGGEVSGLGLGESAAVGATSALSLLDEVDCDDGGD